MSDTVILRHEESELQNEQKYKNGDVDIPQITDLQAKLNESCALVNDIVLKQYLYKLNELSVIPIPEELKDISSIRLFKINEMVYQKDEYSTYKFASVFSSLQNLKCSIFVLVNSNGKKTDFYMGVRSYDNKRTTNSMKETLKNSLYGEFPGVKTKDFLDNEAQKILQEIPYKNIASVSCVARNKDDEFKNNSEFIQGLEKLALAMQGQKYSLIVLAKSVSEDQLEKVRNSYETIYTQLSPFSNMQLSYAKNKALTISEAYSNGITKGTSHQNGVSNVYTTGHQESTSESQGISRPNNGSNLIKGIGKAAIDGLSILAAPLTGGASIAAAFALNIGGAAIDSIQPTTKSQSRGSSVSDSTSESKGTNESFGTQESEQQTRTNSTGSTQGNSNSIQLTMKNKRLQDMMGKIDSQLKRIDECESIGMWECAAYALSDSQETAEMAAGTYKALMKGEQSGVETSSINFWGRKDSKKTEAIHDYLINFIHPVFEYKTNNSAIPVSAASLVSSNELAIQIGLPRKSVCGFPVIEHADFGKEVVRYSDDNNKKIALGKVFSMGTTTATDVDLDIDSLCMHTFITGSTGSGKSNTVYEILDLLRLLYGIPFLVIEPAKGEYKNVFGQFEDVTVYGTNPNLANMLRINPFKFPSGIKGIHVLEHMDRLVEIFNACWPMYAAMPSILKESIERAYINAGWDMEKSVNPRGEIYPNFIDVLEQIREVVSDSDYSAENKGDYTGALVTRVKSLTTGLNSKIFTEDDISNEQLFDSNVIVDLSRVGSSETKALIMGLIVMKLNEYRMVSGRSNSSLNHVTVLEEAHNILKKTSTEQYAESSNLTGKSVEMLSNSIAEMRTYGEGFIIADQAPGLLDMSVIRNTNTKIILRLPEKSDRQLVGTAAGLNPEQIEELSKLEKGVAAVYQNDWVEPVLVKIRKCDIKEVPYEYNEANEQSNINAVKVQLLNFLVQGRLNDTAEFNIESIDKNLRKLGLSTQNTEFIENEISEYEESGKLRLWEDDNFRILSNHITSILDLRDRVDVCVTMAKDNCDLSEMLNRIILQKIPNIDSEVRLVITQCLMKDMSTRTDNHELRNKIYKSWVEDELMEIK